MKPPAPWEFTCVLKDHWRLINGKELYDIQADLPQRNDVAKEHPEKVAELRALYEPFWDSVSPRMTPVAIDLGSTAENPVTLCSQDWYLPKGNPPWNFQTIRKIPKVTGPWIVNVKKAGSYRVTLRQFPEVAQKPLKAVRARLEVAGLEEEAAVTEGEGEVTFRVELPAGKTELTTWLYNEAGKAGGAYFTDVELLADE